VLGGSGDDVTGPARPRDAFDRQVIRLGGAGREDDLVRLHVQAAGDGRARLLDGVERTGTERVPRARGVAEHLHEVGRHRLEDAPIHGSGGVAVQIDGKLHRHAEFHEPLVRRLFFAAASPFAYVRG
jgi:hypothetical protein